MIPTADWIARRPWEWNSLQIVSSTPDAILPLRYTGPNCGCAELRIEIAGQIVNQWVVRLQEERRKDRSGSRGRRLHGQQIVDVAGALHAFANGFFGVPPASERPTGSLSGQRSQFSIRRNRSLGRYSAMAKWRLE